MHLSWMNWRNQAQDDPLEDSWLRSRNLGTHYHRRTRNEGDRYHVFACRCDLTNKCIPEKEQPLTAQTELFLCLTTELERVEVLQIESLEIKGNDVESHPIQNGLPKDSKTWIIPSEKGHRSCTIRTRLTSDFFRTVLPSGKRFDAVAQGTVILQRINERQKQAAKQEKNHKKKDPKQSSAASSTNSTGRFLQQNNTGGVITVTTPFEVNLLLQPSESDVTYYILKYSWLVLLIIGVLLCFLSACCKLRMEKQRQEQRRKPASRKPKSTKRSNRPEKSSKKTKSQTGGNRNQELVEDNEDDRFLDEMSLVESEPSRRRKDSDDDEFLDEMSLVPSESSLQSKKKRAHISRV